MIAYFDCFSGISGDMILGALIDLGYPLSDLKTSLSSLKLPEFKMEALTEKRMNLKGTKLRIVLVKAQKKGKTFNEIKKLIQGGKINSTVKEKSIAIFYCLAQAEAFVHQKKIEQVHFHEVGATDSIIDVVGSVLGIHYLNINEIISSPLPLGNGFIQCKHGNLPLPAPATLEVLKGVPVYGSPISGETVTPTGGAIIATLAQAFGPMLPVRIKKVGYGVGERNGPSIPNLLRIILGVKETNVLLDPVVVIESNIDNMNPEIYEYLIEVLFEKGALDVSLIPVQMKKNRPGSLLKVIALEKEKSELIKTLFKETTTIGVRAYTVERFKLPRKTDLLDTPWGKVRIKIIEEPDGNSEIFPEYEDCKKIARKTKISLKEVFRKVNNLVKS
ncbi:MAG TPA: nickel pincer cofactor biosynthesis protein LarC [Candidatus Atribacteria bacterium]|nr:nickel pincer cofactor biosynthesis protein LarC [Candidatus Atribacteria bacterium]